LIDRFKDLRYRTEPIRVFRDLAYIQKEAGEKKRILIVPVVFCEKLSKKVHRTILNEKSIAAKNTTDSDVTNSEPSKSQEVTNHDEDDERILWSDLELAAVIPTSMLSTNDILNFEQFTEKLERELARLRSINIDVKVGYILSWNRLFKIETKSSRARSDSLATVKGRQDGTNTVSPKWVCLSNSSITFLVKIYPVDTGALQY
uniref:Autophagy-related protein 13 n=1 Tax=Toxocara canis TaxID=6265 RepID=A0A183U3Q1_TOXCA